MKKVAALLLSALFGMALGLSADPVRETALAEQALISDQQMLMLNKLAIGKDPTATNQLRTITLGSIFASKEAGYSNKEIFERANETNDPRLPQLHEIGYPINQNVLDYLSPTNNLAAKTSPTPEPVEDVQKRMEIEDAIKAAPKPTPPVDDKKEMLRIYNEAMKMQQQAEMKALRNFQ